MLMRMYTRWAEKHGYKVQLMEESEGEQAGIKSVTLQITGPECLWLVEDGGRRAPSGAHQSLRRERASADQLCQCLGLSGGGRQYRDRGQRKRPEGRHLPCLGRRRPAREQDRKRDPDHALAKRDRRGVPDRPQPAPQPGHRHADAESATVRTELQRREAAPQRRKMPRPTSAGVTKSAATCWRLINWSKIFAPTLKPAIPPPSWMASWMISWRRRSPHVSAPRAARRARRRARPDRYLRIGEKTNPVGRSSACLAIRPDRQPPSTAGSPFLPASNPAGSLNQIPSVSGISLSHSARKTLVSCP